MSVQTELTFKTAAELAALMKKKTVSPVEVVAAFLDRIESLNPKLNAFITITREHAMNRARQAEREIRAGKHLGPLHGVPYGAKDLFATRGIRTTNGSKVTRDRIPDFESTATLRLNQAGAILVGKLNMAEFAYGGDAVLSGFGPPRNPWHTDYSAAGSSNGSGVAVAARLVPLALGTDTGGSIRLPSSFCGVVGLKPTYGRVSRHGVTTLSWTEDHAGPIARTALDAAAMLEVIAGPDRLDPSAVSDRVPPYSSLMRDAPLKGLRIGILRQFFEKLHPAVEKNVQAAISEFEKLGVKTHPVEIQHLSHVQPAALTIMTAEAACFHENRIRNSADLIDPFLRVRLEAAMHTPATDYIKAQRVRRMIQQEMESAFSGCDVILCPTMTIPAYKLDLRGGDPDRGPTLTTLANLTGVPAIAIPCGFTDNEPALPVSMMLHAKPLDELLLLRLAHVYQSVTTFHERIPSAVS